MPTNTPTKKIERNDAIQTLNTPGQSTPISDFSTLGLAPSILNSLKRMGITTPTPVQAYAIPPALVGKDILASAQTGTGKTLAYLLPLLTKLQDMPRSVALILTPTRELATQVKAAIHELLGRLRLNTALIIGGEPMFKQYAALKRQPKMIIGTPGRINDHLNRGTLRLHDAHYLILDEADRMMDMGFSDALQKIAEHLPKERQTFMFSATFPSEIIKLSQIYLKNPERIAIGSTTEPTPKVKQELIQTASSEKFSHLLRELEQREGSVIIFVKTKIGAEKLCDKLQDKGLSADAIHGDLKQRRRDQVIRAFREERKRILVATDIAARGLDIPHIKLVINFDLPQCPEDYIHRIGRTGRAGMEGCALSFISPDERWKWKAIHRLMNPEASKESKRSTSFDNKPRRNHRFKEREAERGKPRNNRDRDRSRDRDRNRDRDRGRKKREPTKSVSSSKEH